MLQKVAEKKYAYNIPFERVFLCLLAYYSNIHMHACGLFSGVNAPNLKSSYTWLILSEKINLAIEIVTMLLRF